MKLKERRMTTPIETLITEVLVLRLGIDPVTTNEPAPDEIADILSRSDVTLPSRMAMPGSSTRIGFTSGTKPIVHRAVTCFEMSLWTVGHPLL